MKLIDLFEKDSNQKIDIADPKTKYLLQKARSKYAQADSDVEAFVNFMRDEVDDEKERIQKNASNISKEHEKNKVQQKEIDHQARVDQRHNDMIQRISKQEKEIEDKINAMNDKLDNQLRKMDRKTLDNTNIEY